MRRDPITGELLDTGPDSEPCPISEARRAALLMAQCRSQRRRLLRSSSDQECPTAQPADDDPPSRNPDFGL